MTTIQGYYDGDEYRLPELKAFYQTIVKCPTAARAKKMREWLDHRITFPEWSAPFFIMRDAKRNNRDPYVCTRYNHPLGRGCGMQFCRQAHLCVICGSTAHGAFFVDDNSFPVCTVRRAWDHELDSIPDTLANFVMCTLQDADGETTSKEELLFVI